MYNFRVAEIMGLPFQFSLHSFFFRLSSAGCTDQQKSIRVSQVFLDLRIKEKDTGCFHALLGKSK